MKLRKPIFWFGAPLLLIAVWVLAKPAQSGDTEGKPTVIRGLLRDIACPVQNQASTSRKFNKQCAIDCAKLGSPLSVLTDDGTMYLVISESMPDVPQNEKLMPFVGKYVEVSGRTFERKGQRAIVISKINEDKSVALTEVSE
jgi:hypothetical protein